MKAPATLRERALRLLARREHSRAELRRKLAAHAESPEALEALLADLVERKLLSEARFAEGRARVLSRKYGAAHIEYDLRARGVPEETAAAAAREARGTEFERALAIWRRKFGAQAKDVRERARQARFLASRGFSAEVVSRVLRHGEK